MARERIVVECQELFIKLLMRALNQGPDAWEDEVDVADAMDVDAIERLPLVLVAANGGTMVGNGGPGLHASSWTVSIVILHEDKGKCSALSDHVYGLMHGFHDSLASIAGVGNVVLVDDISIPSHSTTTITPAGGLTQFDGAWSVIVKK